jgi:hypothetical protein
MSNTDWRMSDARLTQLEQNGGKLRLARNLRPRARSHPLRPYGTTGDGSDAGTHAGTAAAGVGMLRFGYAPDAPLGRYGEGFVFKVWGRW